MENPVRVLIVDDEEDFLRVFSYWLKAKGYWTSTALNGYEAVGMVRNGLTDMIFLDINMPLIDGIETLRLIRQLNKDIPVIIITAYTTDRRIDKTKDLGISGFFCKSDEFEDIIPMIETVLRSHRGLKRDSACPLNPSSKFKKRKNNA